MHRTTAAIDKVTERALIMSQYFQLPARTQKFGYPDSCYDDVRLLHRPAEGLSPPLKRNCDSPVSTAREETRIKIEELERSEEENGIVVLKKVESSEEDSRVTEDDDMKQAEDHKEEDEAAKDDDKNAETFVAVIAQSILSVPTKRMTLSSIYSFIAKNYPHFDKEKGPGWRNSVRHNLSSNDCFVKASRAENGKGHYWMIHPKDLPEFSKGNFRRRRKPRRPKCSHSLMFRDAPLYYHSYGLGYSPYAYAPLRASQEPVESGLPLPPYGSTERALAHRLRARPGLLSAYNDRAGMLPYPYSYPSMLSYRGLGEAGRTTYPGLGGHHNSSFHPVHQHSCSCHR